MPRINHNVPAMITGAALSRAGREMQKTLEKLSTGLRINRASDDAAGLSVSESLRTQVRGLAVNKRNAMDGISMLNIAEGAMNEISDMLQRMRELAIQADNDTLTLTERNYLNQEYQHLISEIDRTATAAQFNKMGLLDGTWNGSATAPSVLHVGPNNTAAVDLISITIDTVTTGVTGLNLQGGALTGVTLALSKAAISTALSSIDVAIDSVNSTRANLGAFVNRLEHTLNNIENQHANMSAAESVIRDTDFAEETSAFSRHQIITQSATAMLAQANLIPQSVLGLMQG
jgi:flagellin